MSCLSKSHRINTQREFKQLYNSNKKWHTKSFVVFYSHNEALKLAFVSSKKIGNAVVRNKARRKLRALALQYEKNIKMGKYIFVAKSELFNRNHKTLQKDFQFAMKKLGLFEL